MLFLNEFNITEKEILQPIIDDLRGEIPRKMKETSIPGLAITLVSKNHCIWTECFGYTDMKKTHSIDVDTLFCLQSTTKTVTTVAFLLAVQKGLVKLDDPVIEIWPEFTVNSRFGKDEFKKITFRHLLAHSSGLAKGARVGGVFNYDPCTFKEHVESILDSWLLFPVGQGFSYSNMGVNIAAYALEQITKTPYPKYVQKTLGGPLNITFHYDTRKIYEMSNAAKGYLGKRPAPAVDPVGLGCGAAYLSINDQATFARFLLGSGTIDGRPILRSKFIEEMQSCSKEGWHGLGTFIGNDFGATFYFHPGGGFGLRSELYWLPVSNFSVVVFANQEYEQYLGPLTRRIVMRALKAKGVDSSSTDFPFRKHPPKDVDESALECLEGVYHGAWSTVGIKLHKGNLYLTYPNRKIELTPYSSTAFGAKSPTGVIFQLTQQNSPISMKMYSDQLGVLHLDYLGKPPKERGSNRERWRKFTGKYTMKIYDTIQVSLTVKVDSDGYLHLEGWTNERLYEHPDNPNLFFTFQGDAALFNQDHLLYSNIKWDRSF